MWGCMGLLVRPLNNVGLQSMDIVLLRSQETWILTLLTMPLLSKLTHSSIKQDIKIKPKDIWVFLGTGVVSIIFFNFCYFTTIILTSLSVAAILLYTSPIFVMLISAVVFKDKITKYKVISLILAFVGCLVVTGAITGNMVVNVAGVLYGLGAGLGYALYSIFGKIATDKGYSSVTVTLYTFIVAGLAAIPFTNISHIIGVYKANPNMILYTIFMILITTYLPYILYTAGLAGLEPGKAAIIACIEPVMATFVGWIAFNEVPALITILGVLMVLAAIVLINAKNTKTN